MTQNALDYSQNPSGADLMDVFLAGMADNQLTNHSGVSRPSYAKAGTFWIDTSASPWRLKQFTGSNDITIGTLDQSGLTFTASRAVLTANGTNIDTALDSKAVYPSQTGQAGKFLTTNGQTVTWGTVDLTAKANINSPSFTGTPLAPTPLTTDSSTKLATTAYVRQQIQKVSVLPVSPVANVLYVIPE